MYTLTHARRFVICLAIALFLLLAAGAEAYAQSPCRIGFLSGSTPTFDGDRMNGMTDEWADASVITSSDISATTPCFGKLLDKDGVAKPVTVLTKRYMRSGVEVLGFYVEVTDASSSGVVLSSGGVPRGERFVIELDPNLSRGAALGSTAGALDYRVTVAHAWNLSSSSITDAQATLSDSSFTQCAHQSWTAGAMASGLNVAARTMTGGYKFELEIPLSLIGISGAFPASEIGVAFAVINDFGGCLTGTSGASCPNSGYVAFPNSLPISTTDNPVTGCHLSWIVPNNWATSSSTSPPPGQVTIVRTPDWWNSDGIKAFQCDPMAAEGYTYYPDHPCKIVLKAWLRNSTGAPQVRNLVFLWAKHGSGDPLDYNFVDLIENVTVNPTSGTMMDGPFATGLWAGMPVSEPNHPCVRVYILPAVLRSDFDRDTIRSINSRAMVNDMVTKYGLIDDNWAQKNITRHDTETACPTLMCQTVQAHPAVPPAGEERAELSPPPVHRFAQGGLPVVQTRDAFSVTDASPPAAVPAPPAANAVVQRTGGAGSNAGQETPPVLRNPGSNIAMRPEELRAVGQDNVVVQVRSFETETSAETTSYRFSQETGGVIQLFPVKMLEQKGSVPFQLNVTGSNRTRRLDLKVDLYAPPAIRPNIQIAIDTREQTLGPNETRVVRGVLTLKGAGTPAGGGFKRWGLSLHGGVSFPHGSFDTAFNPGPNFAVDLEYRLTQTFSLEGIYGFHRFTGETFGTVKVGDLNLHQFSFNGKIYGGGSPVRPFFNFGGGVYHFGAVGTTNGGLNVGGGIQFDVTPTFAVEGVYNFHNIFTSGQNTRFSALQGGVRFRF